MRTVNAPDIYLMGAQKASTTSMAEWLSSSPQISGSKPKETEHFTLGRCKQYNKCFKGNGLWLDSTPSGYCLEFAERLYNANPACKIIYIVREPMSRAYSAWKMYGRGNKLGGFVDYCRQDIAKLETLNSENDTMGIVRRSMYADVLESVLNYFDSDNVLVLSFDKVIQNSKDEQQRIFDFLGIDPIKSEYPRRNKTSGNSDIPKSDDLVKFFNQQSERLFNLIGWQPYNKITA